MQRLFILVLGLFITLCLLGTGEAYAWQGRHDVTHGFEPVADVNNVIYYNNVRYFVSSLSPRQYYDAYCNTIRNNPLLFAHTIVAIYSTANNPNDAFAGQNTYVQVNVSSTDVRIYSITASTDCSVTPTWSQLVSFTTTDNLFLFSQYNFSVYYNNNYYAFVYRDDGASNTYRVGQLKIINNGSAPILDIDTYLTAQLSTVNNVPRYLWIKDNKLYFGSLSSIYMVDLLSQSYKSVGISAIMVSDNYIYTFASQSRIYDHSLNYIQDINSAPPFTTMKSENGFTMLSAYGLSQKLFHFNYRTPNMVYFFPYLKQTDSNMMQDTNPYMMLTSHYINNYHSYYTTNPVFSSGELKWYNDCLQNVDTRTDGGIAGKSDNGFYYLSLYDLYLPTLNKHSIHRLAQANYVEKQIHLYNVNFEENRYLLSTHVKTHLDQFDTYGAKEFTQAENFIRVKSGVYNTLIIYAINKNTCQVKEYMFVIEGDEAPKNIGIPDYDIQYAGNYAFLFTPSNSTTANITLRASPTNTIQATITVFRLDTQSSVYNTTTTLTLNSPFNINLGSTGHTGHKIVRISWEGNKGTPMNIYFTWRGTDSGYFLSNIKTLFANVFNGLNTWLGWTNGKFYFLFLTIIIPALAVRANYHVIILVFLVGLIWGAWMFGFSILTEPMFYIYAIVAIGIAIYNRYG